MATPKAWCLSLVFVFLSLLVLSSSTGSFEREPFHKILGIKRKATNDDIRLAYKRLVRQWHPDKTDHPKAHQKFLQIQQAYEQLMLLHGSDYMQPPNYKTGHHQLEDYLRFYSDRQVTEEDFKTKLMSKSMETPILMVIFHEQCYRCAILVEVYRSLEQLLDDSGIDFVAVNSLAYPSLTKRAGLRIGYSGLSLLIKRRFTAYQTSEPNVKDILRFIHWQLKQHIVIKNCSGGTDVKQFLKDAQVDGYVRALIAAPDMQKSLVYLVAAFAWRQYVTFGYISMGLAETLFQVKPLHKHTMIIFQEDTENPVARLITSNMTKEVLWPILEAYHYMQLPRLRSQRMLDELCPPANDTNSTRPCAVLICGDTASHEVELEALRRVSALNDSIVRYVYLHAGMQKPFVKALLKQHINTDFLSIVVILRQNRYKVAFERIGNINWTNQQLLKQSVEQAAKVLLNSCWTTIRNVPRLRNEVQCTLLWRRLNSWYTCVPMLIVGLTIVTLLLLGLYAASVKWFEVKNLLISLLPTVLYVPGPMTPPSNFGKYVLLLISAKRPKFRCTVRHYYRSQRDMEFIHMTLHFGTLRWYRGTTRHAGQLYATTFRPCRHGLLIVQDRRGLPLYSRRNSKRYRKVRRRHSRNGYIHCLLALVPWSFLESMQQTPLLSPNWEYVVFAKGHHCYTTLD